MKYINTSPTSSIVLLFLGIVFVLLSSSQTHHCATAASSFPPPKQHGVHHTRSFSSCLAASGVSNFSLAGSPSYGPLLNFSIQNLRFARAYLRKPDAVVLPTSRHDLQRAVLCARAAALAIRVRSGGHSSEGQSYTVSGGAPDGRAVVDYPFVVIDLMNLNRVRVDAAAAIAWVESGATLGEAYLAVARASASSSRLRRRKMSLALAAGTCPTVGVGGHVSGGGFGALSRKHALAADNVLDAILVDAKGRVLDRRAMGEEVFWAIRGGGGGSWGVVYAWKLRLAAVPSAVTVLTPTRNGTKAAVAALVHRWQFVAPALPDEFYLAVNLTIGGPPEWQRDDAVISVSFVGLVLGPKELALSVLREKFPELGLAETEVAETSWVESAARLAGLSSAADLASRVPDPKASPKRAFQTKTDFVRQPISHDGLTALLRYLAGGPPGGYVSLDPYGGAMARAGAGDTPFPHRAGVLYGLVYVVVWNPDYDDVHAWWEVEPYSRWLQSLYWAVMWSYVPHDPRAAYVNYLDLELDPRSGEESIRVNSSLSAVERARVTFGAAYFTVNNYDRLVRAKTLIDPDNVFNHAQSIPPLQKQA